MEKPNRLLVIKQVPQRTDPFSHILGIWQLHAFSWESLPLKVSFAIITRLTFTWPDKLYRFSYQSLPYGRVLALLFISWMGPMYVCFSVIFTLIVVFPHCYFSFATNDPISWNNAVSLSECHTCLLIQNSIKTIFVLLIVGSFLPFDFPKVFILATKIFVLTKKPNFRQAGGKCRIQLHFCLEI